jgi:hypothetical protein
MEKRLAEDPEDWRATQYFEKKKGAKVRRCTYCNLKGHNRATCPELKIEVAGWKKKNAAFRKELATKLLEQGYGVGSIIKHDRVSWRLDGTKGLLVLGLNVEATINCYGEALIVAPVSNPSQREGVVPPRECYEVANGYYNAEVALLAPTKNCLLKTVPNPLEWLKGGDLKWIKKQIFGSSQSDNWHENKYVE